MKKQHNTDSSDTEGRILDAATDVIAQRGYSGAGIQEIVDLSGTSKGSFYFHFPSKEAMAFALVESMSNKLIKKVQLSIRHEPTPLHRLVTSVDVLMATFGRQRKVAQVLLLNVIGHGKATDKKFLPIRERFSSLIRDELDQAVNIGQIDPQDTSLLAEMWIGALHEVILRWLLREKSYSLVSKVPYLTAALMKSVGAPSHFVENLTTVRVGDQIS